ncbi:MAG TPA: helix-turn-helix domain-containing protein [Solirubrobacteraceae bacterium]|nr:helix-turn-helix domain-containing protein [Solirubrobacteraceae bacterium]
MRALSKAVFGGAQYRVEIGAAIADLDEFKDINASALAKQTGISKQSVGHELRLLESAGLIVRTAAAEDSARKVYFTRSESAYWDWCREARTNATAMLARKAPY